MKRKKSRNYSHLYYSRLGECSNLHLSVLVFRLRFTFCAGPRDHALLGTWTFIGHMTEPFTVMALYALHLGGVKLHGFASSCWLGGRRRGRRGTCRWKIIQLKCLELCLSRRPVIPFDKWSILILLVLNLFGYLPFNRLVIPHDIDIIPNRQLIPWRSGGSC